MAGGWQVDTTADVIVFDEPPPNGAAITVVELSGDSYNATSIWAHGAWSIGNGFPAEVEFYSDRLFFANTYLQPQTLWASKTGAYIDFGKSVPLLDSDALTLTILARQVNSIQDLVPLPDLVVMTTSAEWRLTTGADEVVAPGKVGFKPQTYYGASRISTQVVGETAIFVQGRGNIVRDLGFEFTKDGYSGNDLTIYASHLVEGFQIMDVAYQQAPYSCIWMVRSDGALISLTYVREQEVVGWALHSTDGYFESVWTVPEGDINAVYVTVRRTIDGTERVYVERLADRDLTDERDAFFVDCGLTFDGRLVSGTQTLSGGVAWDEDEELTLTASVARWVGASDEGDQVRLVLETRSLVDGDLVVSRVTHRVEIIDYVSSTVVKVRSIGEVPVEFQDVAIQSWELMRDTMTGLEHLEGETVIVLADGNVQGDQDDMVVTGGSLPLNLPASVVHVGLRYRSVLESLDINVQGSETVRDRPKNIKKVALLVNKTRGLLSGPSLTGTLDEFKMREFEDYGESVTLLTGVMDVNTSSSWDKNGRFVVVQNLPLPATILSLVPDVSVGGAE